MLLLIYDIHKRGRYSVSCCAFGKLTCVRPDGLTLVGQDSQTSTAQAICSFSVNRRAESITILCQFWADFFFSKLLQFLHGTFSSFKDHYPKFIPLICTKESEQEGSSRCCTSVMPCKCSPCKQCTNQRKKLWAVFFERTEGPIQKLKQLGAKT